MKTENRTVKKAPFAGIKLKRSSALLLGLIPLLFASPSYAAYDYKIQPGSACQPVDGAQAGDFLRYPNYLYNRSNSIRYVVCPLVRDTSYQAKIDMGIWVASGGGGLSCTLLTTDYVGGSLKFTPSWNLPLGSSNTLPHPHYFKLEANETFWSGPYSIQCILPPKSKVFYSISGEDAATDNGF
ncbi:MAG: hypothetical protein KME17_06990 [Cyanosarcina radialis HA8281-LM2]|jgi:hypothetical protein|nr:hypothetical protein [Cyanosarcina radialis HA8281-LM2]